MLSFRWFALKTYAAQGHIWPWIAINYKQIMEKFSQIKIIDMTLPGRPYPPQN